VTWLLKLYPRSWRRRYGREFLALIAPQRFSISTAMDIIGGAIDAWTQPQEHLTRAASHPEGDTIMLAKAMRLRCAGYGAKVTTVDALKSAGVMLGGSVVTAVFALWMRTVPGGNSYRMAAAANLWLIPFIISMRYWSLKGWPGRTQAVFMGVLISAIVALTVLAGWIGRG
jgi:hypothetical protein